MSSLVSVVKLAKGGANEGQLLWLVMGAGEGLSSLLHAGQREQVSYSGRQWYWLDLIQELRAFQLFHSSVNLSFPSYLLR